MKCRTLSDETNICIPGIRTFYSSTGINAATFTSADYIEILNQYKEITQPFQSTDTFKYQTIVL